jgi:uncharacterized membrane protein
MKQSRSFHLLFPFIMLAIPWVYLAIIWNDLPPTIPTHFGISGEPDRFGSKNEVLIAPVVLTLAGILIYFIMRNIHRIDPKKKYTARTASVLSKFAVVTIVLMCGLMLMVFHWTLKGKVEGMPVLFCGISLFFAYIGNLMHSIKPNYFAGFRLPWTLESEDNWRLTHHLASKIWFIGGIILAIASLVINIKFMIFIFFGATVTMAIVPIIYSYNIYRRSDKSNTNNQYL